MNVPKKIWMLTCDVLKNVFSYERQISYVVEKEDWVIRSYVRFLSNEMRELGYQTITGVTPFLAKTKILHFATIGTLLTKKGLKYSNPSSRVVLSWFHIEEDDQRLKWVLKTNNIVDIFHTSTTITKNILLKNGVSEKKIVVLPLGVDLNLFHTVKNETREIIRKNLHIPSGTFVIGSFQKDGNGWGEGDVPKLVKGPDIFCDTLEKLPEEKKKRVHVLLTGPGRAYVKFRLENIGISYTHHCLKEYSDILHYYHALDCYLITSRAEGGPMALLESWATGVPVISTKVGMSADYMIHNENGMLADVEDLSSLEKHLSKIMDDGKLQEQLVKNGLEIVKNFSWKKLAYSYEQKLYKPLLEEK